MIKINVKLFGAFKKYISTGEISLFIEQPCLAGNLKKNIQKHLLDSVPEFSDLNLVFESALATSERILDNHEYIDGSEKLALLPPVCGG